jgi:hypothetical protein
MGKALYSSSLLLVAIFVALFMAVPASGLRQDLRVVNGLRVKLQRSLLGFQDTAPDSGTRDEQESIFSSPSGT